MTDPVHIVVVDDDSEIRETLRRILEREAFRVSLCSNAVEFWTVVTEGPVDLAMLDIRMPGEDGISIARRLRAETDICIIMVTGQNETMDRVIGLEIGADDYIGKPFDRHELIARVRAVLRRRSISATSVAPLATRMDQITQALEAAAGRIVDAAEKVENRSQEAGKLEDMFKAHSVTSCPQCGSGITYYRAEKGRLGICGACGWTHFVDDC